eukprot:2846833-Pleurochrysis_carterae.AAC.1
MNPTRNDAPSRMRTMHQTELNTLSLAARLMTEPYDPFLTSSRSARSSASAILTELVSNASS